MNKSPDDASRYCNSKVIVPLNVQAEVEGRGGKNWLTISDRGAVILVVKLKRTDTTLDLSQKARVVRKQECRARPYIGRPNRARAIGRLVANVVSRLGLFLPPSTLLSFTTPN